MMKKRGCANNLINIVKNGDCHLWQGRLDACGYGEIRLMFRGRRISLKAHRAVFAMSIVLTRKIGLNLVDCSSSYSCWYCVHSLVKCTVNLLSQLILADVLLSFVQSVAQLCVTRSHPCAGRLLYDTSYSISLVLVKPAKL